MTYEVFVAFATLKVSVLYKYKELADDWNSLEIRVICNEDDRDMNNESIRSRILNEPNAVLYFAPLTSSGKL